MRNAPKHHGFKTVYQYYEHVSRFYLPFQQPIALVCNQYQLYNIVKKLATI